MGLDEILSRERKEGRIVRIVRVVSHIPHILVSCVCLVVGTESTADHWTPEDRHLTFFFCRPLRVRYDLISRGYTFCHNLDGTFRPKSRCFLLIQSIRSSSSLSSFFIFLLLVIFIFMCHFRLPCIVGSPSVGILSSRHSNAAAFYGVTEIWRKSSNHSSSVYFPLIDCCI